METVGTANIRTSSELLLCTSYYLGIRCKKEAIPEVTLRRKTTILSSRFVYNGDFSVWHCVPVRRHSACLFFRVPYIFDSLLIGWLAAAW